MVKQRLAISLQPAKKISNFPLDSSHSGYEHEIIQNQNLQLASTQSISQLKELAC